MFVDNPTADREAETEATATTAEKRSEQPWQVGRGNSGTLIAHDDLQRLTAVWRCADFNRHLAGCGRVLNRVLNQIHEDAFEAAREHGDFGVGQNLRHKA